MHLSRDLLLVDVLIFVNIIKEIIVCVVFVNASAEGILESQNMAFCELVWS